MLNLTTIVDAVRDLTAALKEVAFELREARLMLTKKPQQLQFPVIPSGLPPETRPKSK